MRATRFILIITLSLLLFWYLKITLFNDAGQEKSSGDAADSLTERVQSFSLEGFSETGEKTWQINGKSADIYSDIINLSEINADSYSKDIKVNLKSDKGVFNRSDNNLQLNKNVIVTTSDGTKMTTESMQWNAKEESLSTKERVYIERSDINADGLGAYAKPNLKKVKLEKDVRVDVKKPPAVITCDGSLEIDYNNNVAYFNKNVALDDKKAKINTDKATAYFDPEKRLLKKVLCEGNVEIMRGEDITRCDIMTYLPDEGRVVLEGRPQIVVNSAKSMIEEIKK